MLSSPVKSVLSSTENEEMPTPQLSQASLPQQQQQQHQPRTTGQRPQKLRLSCDACAAAKVKCSKERPRCERCNGSDLNCVYGPSMKHGKPEKKRKLAEAQSSEKTSNSAPNAQGHFVSPVNQSYYNDLQQSYSDLLRNVSGSKNFGTYPWNSNNGNVIPRNFFTPPPAESSFPSLVDPFWPDGLTSGHHGSESLTPPNNDLNSTLAPLDTSTPMLSSLDYSHQYINPESLKSVSSPSSSASLSGLGGHEAISRSHTRHNSTGAHDCYMLATSTLASLHFRSQPFHEDGTEFVSSLYSDPSPVFPTSAPTSQTLDDVLRSTQEAINNVFQLLRCSCADDPHMAMLYASIIVKVIYWHQVAAGISTPSSKSVPTSEGLPSPAGSSPGCSSGESRNSPCSSAAPFISSEPIKIGTYTPDEEDQEPIRRLFLLSNLKKTGRLVDAFATVGNGVDARTSNLYGSMASWLKSELSRTIKEVGNGAQPPVIP